MTRPIVWAIGTLVTAAISAVTAGDRLAALTSPSGRASPPAAAGVPVEAGVLVLQADLRGHFVVHPAVDGRRVRMLVDTGASYVALSHDDAFAAGIHPQPRDYTLRSSTANGIVAAAPVRLRELTIGTITLRNVDAVVLPPGKLATSLLGMSFLRRLKGFEMAQGRLTLRG